MMGVQRWDRRNLVSNELNALLARVEKQMDETTARDLRRHIEVLKSRREFGLSFERHMPESVDLIGRPISVGDKVGFIPPRGETTVESDATWLVTAISGTKAKRIAALLDPQTKEESSRPLDDLVYDASLRNELSVTRRKAQGVHTRAAGNCRRDAWCGTGSRSDPVAEWARRRH